MIKSMVLVLYVGAAWRVATPQQKHEMRETLASAMGEYRDTGDASGVQRCIEDSLGPVDQWIQEQDAVYIVKLGGGLIGRETEPRNEEGQAAQAKQEEEVT